MDDDGPTGLSDLLPGDVQHVLLAGLGAKDVVRLASTCRQLRALPLALAAHAAFSCGVSSQPDIRQALREACDMALQQMAPVVDFALVFTAWPHGENADVVAALAPCLPPGCLIVGCQGRAVIGWDGHTGELADADSQHSVSLLLGRLPGRRLSAFTAVSQAVGPGARHRAGGPISGTDAAADRESLRRWLALPVNAQPASILLFCRDTDTAALALPHAHGMLTRLQRAFPDALVTGAMISEAHDLYCSSSNSSSNRGDGGGGSSASAGAGGKPKLAQNAARQASFCGLAICKAGPPAAPASDAGAAGEPAEVAPAAAAAVAAPGPFVAAALSVKGLRGEPPVFYGLSVQPRVGYTRNSMHPILGDIPLFAVLDASADPAVLRQLFVVDADPAMLVPAPSVMMDHIMGFNGSAEMAFWCADRTEPGSYEASVQSGRGVVVAEMTLQQSANGGMLILGTVPPLEQAAFDALLAAAKAPGKTLCAQFILMAGAQAGPDILAAELPILLSRRPVHHSGPAAAAAGAVGAARSALFVAMCLQRGLKLLQAEGLAIQEAASRVPLVGVCCEGGEIAPDVPNYFCGLRCLQDDPTPVAAGQGVPAAAAAAGAAAALQQRLQEERYGVDRSDALSHSHCVSLFAG